MIQNYQRLYMKNFCVDLSNNEDIIYLDGSNIVTLETAKKLKASGFDVPTYHYYLDKDLPFVSKGLHRVKLDDKRMNHNKYDEFIYSAPDSDELKNWKIIRHTNEQRIDGDCRVCTKNKDTSKKCYGFGMVGDRACDTRHRPNYKLGDSYILCEHHNKYKKK